MNNQDKREHPRVKIKQTVAVADERSLLLAEVEDLTVGGISLLAENQLAAAERFYVVFPGAGDIKENEVEAEVLRCEAVSSDSALKYRIGAKFIDANSKYVEDVIRLLKG